MRHTKKVGIAGKYGNRVGKKIRDEIKKIHHLREESHCPQCAGKVRKINLGIWLCKSCGVKFSGKAYYL